MCTWSPMTEGVMLQGRLVIIPITVSTASSGTEHTIITQYCDSVACVLLEYSLDNEGKLADWERDEMRRTV